MKNFDSRTYSINDFLEWNDKDQLQLSPKFQRKSVWTDAARSYLIDTIIRGKPIPKVFIRQKLNINTRQSIREVVDGQQRLRTILSFLNDDFTISKKHNTKFGGFYFSQLHSIDEDIQSHILNYEISVDLLVNLPDEEILDIFSRLNSYAVTLNEQEKIHASHFSSFKILVDKVAHKYNDFWIENKILTNQKVLRMEDATLVSDLIIAMVEGVQSKKQIKSFYNKYEKDCDIDIQEVEIQFDTIIHYIQKIFPENLKKTEFNRIHLFYTLFTSIYHCIYGLKNLENPRVKLDDLDKINTQLNSINAYFDLKIFSDVPPEVIQFLDDSRRATTDTKVRLRRTEFLINLLKKI